MRSPKTIIGVFYGGQLHFSPKVIQGIFNPGGGICEGCALILPMNQVFGASVWIVSVPLMHISIRSISLIHIKVVSIFYYRWIVHIRQVPLRTVSPGGPGCVIIRIGGTIEVVGNLLIFISIPMLSGHILMVTTGY